ncbi:hypothetical protein M8818_001125 [Zalaria obscura]|uniref:Uncharacterized protein n=1 Tax=Zalaria obscura TaxID=2024903 RepID=A0ACC3SMU6_9PEZI
MDSAKNAVKDFMSKAGHHDTTVHEKVAPAVQHETINKERHEQIQTALDKEVHQDHYHTSVQPVKDTEIRPEQHHHNLGAVEHRTFEHGNDREIAERLKTEAARFHDEKVRGETRETQSVEPTIAGEHVHHHVHETIQPVVNKQTIEPHVVHTTVPIHEVHHNAAQHHSTSALPAVSMSEFTKQGGVLTGREERYDGFEGEPRSVGGALGGSSSSTTGTTGTGVGSELRQAERSATGHHNTTGTTGTTGTKTSGTAAAVREAERDATGRSTGTHGTSGTSGSNDVDPATGKKASLLDRINPMKDTDHDGKRGVMD